MASDHAPRRPRQRWWIIGAVAVIVVGGGFAFWWIVPHAGDDPAVRLAAIQVATGLTGGIVAAVTAIVLICRAWLQNQSVQLQRQAHALQVQKNQQDQADALARQVTDLINSAVEQLAADNPESQIVGLHQLDRLGREHPDQRATIAEVWCNLLRTAAPAQSDRQQVRTTAQRLLLDHLRTPQPERSPATLTPPDSADYWALRRIDLRNAVLTDADFTDCLLPEHFDARAATFTGHTSFTRACFQDSAVLTGARFTGTVDGARAFFAGECNLDSVSFTGGAADFTSATFRGPLGCQAVNATGAIRFQDAQFEAPVQFGKSTFAGTVDFSDTRWCAEAGFTLATFEGFAGFSGAVFIDRVIFNRAMFGGPVTFESAQFGRNANFPATAFCDTATFIDAHFDQDARFPDAQFGANASFRDTEFYGQMSCCGARFDGPVKFTAATFKDRADFSLTTLGTEASIDLTDATAAEGAFAPSDRVWPLGWTTVNEAGLHHLIRIPDPAIDSIHTT